MKKKRYEALLERQRARLDELGERRDVERLAEIANNLASLGKLVETRATELATSAVDSEMKQEAAAGGSRPKEISR